MDNDKRKEVVANAKGANRAMISADLAELRADAEYIVSILNEIDNIKTVHDAYINMCDIIIKDMAAKAETIRRRITLDTALVEELSY